MKVKANKPAVLTSSVAALLLAASIPAFAQTAGVFSTSGDLGTADQSFNVGISTSKTYLQTVDLGDTTNTNINGVDFVASGTAVAPSGTGWALTGTANLYGGGGTNPAGPLGTLTNKFVYGGNPATLTLTGLTVGQTYVVTFYNRSWDPAGQRVQNITATGALVASTVYDEDIGAAGQGNLNLLRYTFQAASTTQALAFAPQNLANTMHLYGFSTEQTFNNTLVSGTNWTAATWSGSVPNSAGSNASFGSRVTASSINLDAPQTVGHLQFDGTSPWTVTGSNTLTLQADVGGVSVLSTLAGSHTIATPINLATNATKFGSGTLTLSGEVSGASGLSVNGGKLVLGAANTYTGGTTVNAGGTLQLAAANALTATNGSLTVNTGGTVDLNGRSADVTSLAGTGGTILNNGAGTVTFTAGSGNGSSSFAGVLSDRTTGTGTLALRKIGTGTLTLTGTSSYTGLTTVSGGRLQLDGAAVSSPLTTSGVRIEPTGTFSFSSGVGSTITLKTGSSLTLAGGTIGFDLGAANASDKIVADNLTLTANSSFAFSPVGLLNPGSQYTLATYNTLTNTGGATIAGTTIGRLTLNPVIGATSITLTPILDSGTWNNTSGGTWSSGPWTNYTPNAQGDSAVFGTALTTNGTVTVDSPRTVGYLTFSNPTSSYTLGSTGSTNLTLNNGTASAIVGVTSGSHTLAENVLLSSDAFIGSDAGATLTVRGVLSGAKAVTKSGQGTVILTSNNLYTGGTTVTGGTLQIGDGTTNGALLGNIVDNANVTFNPGSAQTFAASISGTGSVTKVGPALLTLTGANTFQGGFTITGGTVDVGGGTATGSVTGNITNNATLRFSRTGVVPINAVVNGTGTTVIAGGVSQTLSATAAINTPNVTIGDTLQGFLYFGAPNQLNGTTGVVLNIGAHAANSRINLNGFDQTVAGLAGTGIVQNVEAGAATPAATLTINVPGANSYSWTGLIRTQAGGALSLTKTGTGSQTMIFSVSNGSGSYTGPTTISQGQLAFGSTYAAPIWGTSVVNIAAGAELGLTGSGTGAVSWNTNNRVFAGAGSVVRTGADTNTVTISNGTNTYTGATVLNGPGTLEITTLANAGSASSIGAGDKTSPATNAASLVFNGGILRYIGAAAVSDRLFTVSPSGGTLSSVGTGPINLTSTGSLVMSGAGARALTLVATNPGTNVLSAAIPNATGGNTSLIKEQAGTWTLRGANTYTGSTSINGGRLQLEGSAATGTLTTAAVAVNAGSTLGFTAGTGSTLALPGTLTLSGGSIALDLGSAAGSDKITAASLALTANSTLSFNQIGAYEVGTTYTLASYTTLSNAGGFTLSGFSAGRLTLAPVLGANAITLTPSLVNGTWNAPAGGTWSAGPWTGYTPNAVGDAALFGSAITTSKTITVDSPKTVAYLTFNNATASYTIGNIGSGNLTFANDPGAAAQVTVNSGNHTIAEDITLNSDVSIFTATGTGLSLQGSLNGFSQSVTKLGPGTLTLSGFNSFGGATDTGLNINQGTVVLGSSFALPSSGTVALNGGTLNLNANDSTAGALAGTAGTVTDLSTTPGATILTVAQSSNTQFAGTITDGTVRNISVVKAGTGNLVLAGVNTFSGDLTIRGGTVTAASGLGAAIKNNVLLGDGSGTPVWLISGATSQQYGPGTVLRFSNGGTDAKFELRGSDQTLAGIDADSAQSLSIIQNDEPTAAGYTSAPGPATLTLNTATDHSFYGIIRNQTGGALGIIKTGAGTQELINRPDVVGLTYTGATVVNAGKLILNLSGTTSGGFASDITVNSGATLGLDGSWTLSRTISGSGKVEKQGFGVVTLAGTSTYTGDTVISGGTLSLTGSIAGTSKIVVNTGAILDVLNVPGGFSVRTSQTLTGGGTVLGGMSVSGTLAPGDGVGTLLTDLLDFASTATLALEINTSSVIGGVGASDSISANGNFSLSLASSPTLSLTDVGTNAVLPLGTRFNLLTYNGAWNGGLFRFGGTAIPDDGVLTFGANKYRLDYNAGGNSVALVVVPEPAVLAPLFAGTAMLLARRRRKQG